MIIYIQNYCVLRLVKAQFLAAATKTFVYSKVFNTPVSKTCPKH